MQQFTGHAARPLLLRWILAMGLIGLLHAPAAYADGPLLDSLERKQLKRTALGAAVAVPAALVFDEPIMEAIPRQKGSWLHRYTNIANEAGSKKLIIPGSLVMLGAGWILDAPKLQRTSWNAAKSIATTGAVTELIKLSVGRARPYKELGPYHLDPIPWQDNALKAFPSGHTSVAFAFFTPFAEAYSRWMYLIPASVAISRVYKNDHWPSDVLMGATLGFLSGYFFQHASNRVQVTVNGLIIRL